MGNREMRAQNPNLKRKGQENFFTYNIITRINYLCTVVTGAAFLLLTILMTF